MRHHFQRSILSRWLKFTVLSSLVFCWSVSYHWLGISPSHALVPMAAAVSCEITTTECQDFPSLLIAHSDQPASPSAPAVQPGLARFQAGDTLGAIALWRQALQQTPAQSAAWVTILKYLVRAQAQVGQVDAAIAHLNQLLGYYRQVNDRQQFGRMLTEQAQLYSHLGQQRRAITLLCHELSDQDCQPDSALAIARQHADLPGTAAALGSLGNAYRLRGDYATASRYLTASRTIAQQQHLLTYEIAAWHGLGNLHTSLVKRYQRQLQSAQAAGDTVATETMTRSLTQSFNQAIAAFDHSLTLARQQQDPWNELRALLNLAALTFYQPPSRQNTELQLQQAQTLLDRLPDSRETAFATIHLATLWQLADLPSGITSSEVLTRCVPVGNKSVSTDRLLQQALAMAQRIQDPQSTAFALGRLGHLAECRHQYPQALDLTHQAQLTAATAEYRYLWEWQAGRILQATGQPQSAIAAYETAVQTLTSLRADMAIASRDFQFDFRDTIEPIYRQLTALYLTQSPSYPPLPPPSAKAQIPVSYTHL
ncbi:hypothetical protein ACN4EK_31995, partial [Pantanalinema rosaneae CENA516]